MDLLERRRELMSLTFVPHDYSQDYLTFKITSSGTIGMKWGGNRATAVTVQYKLNSGNWTNLTTTQNGVTFNVSAGDTVLWKGNNAAYCGSSSTQAYSNMFTGTASYDVCGNIMSLIGGDNFQTVTAFTANRALPFLFYNTKVVSAKNLILPAQTLTENCYHYLFGLCTTLIEGPVELPATTLASYCYNHFFDSCKITKSPDIKATTLANQCCGSMFTGCTQLVTPPVLSCTSLASSCYQGMFQSCTKLTTAPALPATTLANNCYQNMFYGCTGLETAPDLTAAVVNQYAYYRMFYGCTKLNYIRCTATNITANNCVNGWMTNVASTGTFRKNRTMSSWPSGSSGIPSGWTVINDN